MRYNVGDGRAGARLISEPSGGGHLVANLDFDWGEPDGADELLEDPISAPSDPRDMTRGRKIALGIATAWPILYAPVWLAWIALIGALMPAGQSIAPATPLMERTFAGMLPLHFVVVVLSIALPFYYLIVVYRRFPHSLASRILWWLVVFLLNPVGPIVFFVVHVMPGGKDAVPSEATEVESGGNL